MVISMILAVISGVCVGVLSGLLGVGGGIIMIPLLRLLFGVDALVATGTSLFVILPTSASGVIGRIRSKGLFVKLSLIIGLGGIVFSPIGSWLAEIAGGPASMIAAAIVIAYTGVNMARKAAQKKTEGATATAEQRGRISNGFRNTAACIVSAIAVGVIAGFLSGFIGVGGGFIITPMVMWLYGMPFKSATGVSLLSLCVLSIPGIITHGLYGHIDFLQGAMLAIGSIPGAFLGSALLKRVPEKFLRIAFGCLLVVVAIILAANEFLA